MSLSSIQSRIGRLGRTALPGQPQRKKCGTERVVQEGWYRKGDEQKTGRVEREKRLEEEALLENQIGRKHILSSPSPLKF